MSQKKKSHPSAELKIIRDALKSQAKKKTNEPKLLDQLLMLHEEASPNYLKPWKLLVQPPAGDIERIIEERKAAREAAEKQKAIDSSAKKPARARVSSASPKRSRPSTPKIAQSAPLEIEAGVDLSRSKVYEHLTHR